MRFGNFCASVGSWVDYFGSLAVFSVFLGGRILKLKIQGDGYGCGCCSEGYA